MFPDFVCYWAAGKLVASGESPYDAAAQARVQQAYGWDRATAGFGTYDYLPYYYPPWMAFACVPLVLLDYEAAKVPWFFLTVELVVLGGYLLRGAAPGVPRWIPVVLASVFAFTVAWVLLGQTAVVLFFLMAAAWSLLAARWDRCAGAVLVLLTHKPQLVVVLLPAALLWAVWQRRWGVLQGFLAASAGLSLASWLVIPWWPAQMVDALRQVPPPTEHFPWIGNSWFLVLK